MLNKKRLLILSLILSMIVFSGCNKRDYDALDKIKTVAVPSAYMNLSIAKETKDKVEMSSGISYEVSNIEGLLSQLGNAERKYLAVNIEKLINISFKGLGIDQVAARDVPQKYINKDNVHFFFPKGKVNFDYSKEAIKDMCQKLNCDALASLKLQFVRTKRAEFYNLKFAHTASVSAKLVIYDKNGKKIFADTFWGESKNAIPAYDFFLAKMADKEDLKKYNDIRGTFSFEGSMAGLYKEAIESLMQKTKEFLAVIN